MVGSAGTVAHQCLIGRPDLKKDRKVEGHCIPNSVIPIVLFVGPDTSLRDTLGRGYLPVLLLDRQLFPRLLLLLAGFPYGASSVVSLSERR